MTRSKSALALAAVVIVTLACWPGGSLAGGGPFTERVSVNSAEVEGNNESDYPSVSSDGRYVAFESVATNLVAGDTNGMIDIFVRDRTLGITERVSVSSAGVQANSSSFSASISADGRYVAFESAATSLVIGDTNGAMDIFVRDRVLGTTVRVSQSTGGAQANDSSETPCVSADGRYVAFASRATNLVAGDTNAQRDVFVRDLVTEITSRVSISDSEAQANGDSQLPAMSADGRYVAFQSDATNLWGPDTNGVPDIYLRDRTAGTTGRVSVNNSGTQGNNGSWNPSISGDGRYVAFQSDASNLVAGDAGGNSDIFVHEVETGFTWLESVSSGEVQGNMGSYYPEISANGRFIVFASLASNLVGFDTNGTWDVFLRDREVGTTSRQSVATGDFQADEASIFCSISADGRTVAFRSTADNLVPADLNGAVDVFVHVNSATTIYWSIRGTDRYDTAIKISQAMFPGALPAGSGMVLAPGETFQEALCGAPLAAGYGGPVLLTPSSGLPDAVKNEILRLHPESVTLIGLGPAMQGQIDDLLGEIGAARSIRGSDVYDMSYKVAMALDAITFGGLTNTTAIITRGDVFPDAIGVSPLACYQGWPILLTGSGHTLNAKAARSLSEFGLTKALKVGTYATLPVGVAGVANLSGADRYQTNANVATWARANAGMTSWHLGVTTGDKFPDALAAGPYLARSSGILLLSPLAGPLPPSIETDIFTHRDDVARVTFVAMIEPVVSLVKSLVP